MTPDKLKDLILSEGSSVSAGVALLTFVGLPDCKKADLVQEILQKGLELDPEELMKSAEITEKGTEFRVLELGAFRDGTQTWKWHPFAKRSRYLSCFLSALQRDTSKETIESFAVVKPSDHGKHRFGLFENTELDKCFYNHYQLLTSLYNEAEPSQVERAAERAQVEPAAERTLVDQLKGETTLTLINVWDIGFNKAILHFLPLLCGHLHHNFPILFLGYPNDVGVDSTHLADPLNIDELVDKKLSGMMPILRHYSRAKFLLSFAHLARSSESYQFNEIQMREFGEDLKRKEVCRLVGIVHGEHPKDSGSSQNDPALYPSSLHEKIGYQLDKFSTEAKENLCIENLLGSSWVIYQKVAEDEQKFTKLKTDIDKHVASEKQKDIPLSWYFLRSAFFKTGKLYIKTADLQDIAKECKIIDDKFEEFLETFTGFGSIIHIPVLRKYVILNPPDFFHKLTELYYPRFNGDLKYGIASFSTLRRLFGEDFEFFKDVLTACKLAVEIDSDRIVHDDRMKTKQRRLLFAEECLYIPSIRSVARPDKPCSSTGISLRLVYKKAHLPTHTTEDVVTFLVQNDPNLHLLTCEWYNETRFQYYYQVVAEPDEKSSAEAQPPVKCPLVKLIMTSHGDKNKMHLEVENFPPNRKDVKQLIAGIKENVIRAYCNAEEVYSQHHHKLLGVKPKLELELNCTRDRSKYHNITANIQTCDIQACASCKQNKELMAMCEFASKHWKAR